MPRSELLPEKYPHSVRDLDEVTEIDAESDVGVLR
jgi:hypothetical protein